MMVLGTPHFGNPAQDRSNTDLPDVLSPARQREIELVVERLAAFRPTHIAVEVGAGRQQGLDRRYADYRAGRAQLRSGEEEQIGFRLAARLGHARVHAVDWNDMPPGTEDDWNYDSFARKNGLEAELERIGASGQREAARVSAAARCSTVANWLRKANAPATRAAMHRSYFDYAMLGTSVKSPGATWVGNWYARNHKIFSNLRRLGLRSSDRLLVIYGAGHSYLLDRFAAESGAFVPVQPHVFLPRAGRHPGQGCSR